MPPADCSVLAGVSRPGFRRPAAVDPWMGLGKLLCADGAAGSFPCPYLVTMGSIAWLELCSAASWGLWRRAEAGWDPGSGEAPCPTGCSCFWILGLCSPTAGCLPRTPLSPEAPWHCQAPGRHPVSLPVDSPLGVSQENLFCCASAICAMVSPCSLPGGGSRAD